MDDKTKICGATENGITTNLFNPGYLLQKTALNESLTTNDRKNVEIVSKAKSKSEIWWWNLLEFHDVKRNVHPLPRMRTNSHND